MHFWPSKLGAFYTIRPLFSIRCLRHASFLTALSWKPQIQDPVRILGEAYSWAETFYEGELGGGLGMIGQLNFGRMVGFQVVASYQIESMGDATVSCLIEESSRQWNDGLIDGIFSFEEAELIKKIPLSRMDVEDVLIWPHLQDGQYSCKLGYRFLKDEEAMDNAQDDAITDSKLCKGIWTLQVPNKVKNLL